MAYPYTNSQYDDYDLAEIAASNAIDALNGSGIAANDNRTELEEVIKDEESFDVHVMILGDEFNCIFLNAAIKDSGFEQGWGGFERRIIYVDGQWTNDENW